MKEFIENKILELMDRIGLFRTRLMEKAFYKNDYLNRVSIISDTLTEHILKLLLFGKESKWYNHWIDEIFGYINTINRLRVKKDSIVKPKNIYYLLYEGPLEESEYIEMVIEYLITKYPEEKIVWDTIPYIQFYKQYKNFYLELSHSLLNKTLTKNDVIELINKYFIIK